MIVWSLSASRPKIPLILLLKLISMIIIKAQVTLHLNNHHLHAGTRFLSNIYINKSKIVKVRIQFFRYYLSA